MFNTIAVSYTHLDVYKRQSARLSTYVLHMILNIMFIITVTKSVRTLIRVTSTKKLLTKWQSKSEFTRI